MKPTTKEVRRDWFGEEKAYSRTMSTGRKEYTIKTGAIIEDCNQLVIRFYASVLAKTLFTLIGFP